MFISGAVRNPRLRLQLSNVLLSRSYWHIFLSADGHVTIVLAIFKYLSLHIWVHTCLLQLVLFCAFCFVWSPSSFKLTLFSHHTWKIASWTKTWPKQRICIITQAWDPGAGHANVGSRNNQTKPATRGVLALHCKMEAQQTNKNMGTD